MQGLTNKQKGVLKFILKYINTQGHPPTIREIGKGLRFSSTGTVRGYLTALKRKGFIRIQKNKSRAIEIVKNIVFSMPILGKISAGPMDLAIENIEGYLNWDDLSNEDNTFALRVKGDSMIERGIIEGDLVIVKRQRTASIGDIIVALLNSDEATVKILKKKDTRFFLQPANRNYQPIYKEFNIIGKVIGVIRRYK